MAKNSVEAYSAVGKTNLLIFNPEDLVIVTDPKSPLFDKRVHDELDPEFILNIKHHGVIQPIVVWKNPETGKTEVAAGRRRTRACIEANKLLRKEGGQTHQISATVRRGTPEQMAVVMAIENENREDDTPIRRAEKMAKLQTYNMSDDYIAIVFGCTKQTVRNTVALLEQPAAVRNAVEAGKITVKVAASLRGLPVDEQKAKLEEALAAGEGKSGHAKSRSVRKAVGMKPTMRSRGEITIRSKRVNGEAAAVLLWVLGGEWPSAIPVKE